MDQNQWNALNQMLSRQPKTSPAVNTAKSGVSSGRQSQPGTVQTRVISAGNLSKQLNGGEQTVMETGGSGVVKSLLTGRQYAQSVLRPDIGRGQNKPAAAKSPSGKQQVSVLQPNWQQQSQPDVGAATGAETQQLVLTGLPENIGPGESLYVVVDGVTYQIDSSNAELLAAATGNSTATSGASVGSRMSLEDLANISAEQQNLSLDYQAAGGEMAASTSDMKLEMQAASANEGSATAEQQQLDGQQFLEAQAAGTAATSAAGNGTEPMQIIILPADGADVKGADFKVGGQDFILQPGQQLPRDLQEMVARGLPIDFSNYEFVIQEDDSSAAQDGSGATYLSAGQVLGGSGDATSVMVSLAGSAVAGGSGDDILGMLADASSQQPHGIKLDFQQWAGATSSIPVIEEDDGEFAYVTGNPDDGSGEPVAQIVHRVVTESGFLSAFTDFLSGAKSETLSSVANSTVIRRTPQLPIAYVPELKRKSGSAQDKSKSPMTIVVTEGSSQKIMYVSESGTPVSVSGRGRGRGRGRPPSNVAQRYSTGRSLTAGEAAGTKEQIRQSIISKRKHKGSESDSLDEEDGIEGSFQIAAETDESMEKDLIAASKLSMQEVPRGGHVYKGRGRPRGSSLAHRQQIGRGGMGTPVASSSSTEQITVSVDKDQHRGGEAVFHLNPTEPHNYQKGDFVIERKDVWKTEGFPIWRIETGKLLQKFDCVPTDSGIVHKSASVYSSWSGDIRTSFKAVLVDLISSTAGRKQETVKVQERFLVKPAEDSLDEDPLMATFAVFMHTMLSAALDSSFLASIVQNEEDEYYMSSVRQVDTLLTAATQSILLQITWSEAFKLSADALPYYTMSSLPANSEQTYQCQACEDGITAAVRSVKFYGVVYDRDILTPTGEVEKASAQEFLIGKPAAEILISYHALQHFKFLIHQKCQEEVAYLRQTRKANDVEILTECLQNRIFLQHYFRELQSLLQQFIIVEHAVDPAVDPSVAAGSDQQQVMDEATMVAMKQESEAAGAGESAAQAEGTDMVPVETLSSMEMMDTSTDPSAMDTSSADNQMAFEHDQQTSSEAFIVEGTGPSDIA